MRIIAFIFQLVFLLPWMSLWAEGPVEKRLKTEAEELNNPRVILPHRPNYILPLTATAHSNRAPFQNTSEDFEPDDIEVKFQISLKFPLVKGMFNNKGILYVAYTQLSMWQAYNDNESRPFRESNY